MSLQARCVAFAAVSQWQPPPAMLAPAPWAPMPLEQVLLAQAPRLLLGWSWGEQDSPAVLAAPPLPCLSEPCWELWESDQAVHTLASPWGWARADGEVLGLHLQFAAENLAVTTEQVYDQLLRWLPSVGYPHWLRAWHYIPDLLLPVDAERDRYMAFCQGRARAWQRHHGVETMPAATAIGCQGAWVHMSVLAARTPGQLLENPRQTSARFYPRQYGPTPPGFARACRYQNQVLISGTASIVGHASLHPGQVRAQAQEIQRNLQALLPEAVPPWSGPARLYWRERPSPDMSALAWPWSQPVQLLGEVCRAELLLEVEGVCAAVR